MFEKISKLWKSHVSTGAGDDLPFTLISEKTILDVNSLTGEHPVRVDGILKGDIDIVNCFTLGETGVIDGNINAASAIVAGKVNGDIRCEYSIHLTSTANVNGNVFAASAIVDSGAIVNGYCALGNGNKDFEFKPITRKPISMFAVLENCVPKVPQE